MDVSEANIYQNGPFSSLRVLRFLNCGQFDVGLMRFMYICVYVYMQKLYKCKSHANSKKDVGFSIMSYFFQFSSKFFNLGKS